MTDKYVVNTDGKPDGFEQIPWETINVVEEVEGDLDTQIPTGWTSTSSPNEDRYDEPPFSGDDYQSINQYNVAPKETPTPGNEVIVGVTSTGEEATTAGPTTKTVHPIGKVTITGDLSIDVGGTSKLKVTHTGPAKSSDISYEWSVAKNASAVALPENKTKKTINITGKKSGNAKIKVVLKVDGEVVRAKTDIKIGSSGSCVPTSEKHLPSVAVHHEQDNNLDPQKRVTSFKVVVAGDHDITVEPMNYWLDFDPLNPIHYTDIENARHYKVTVKQKYNTSRLSAVVKNVDVTGGGSAADLELGVIKKKGDYEFLMNFKKLTDNNGVPIAEEDRPSSFARDFRFSDESLVDCELTAENGNEEVTPDDSANSGTNRLFNVSNITSALKSRDRKVAQQAIENWNEYYEHNAAYYNKMIGIDPNWSGVILEPLNGELPNLSPGHSLTGVKFTKGVNYYSDPSSYTIATCVLYRTYADAVTGFSNPYTFLLRFNESWWPNFSDSERITTFMHELGHVMGMPGHFKYTFPNDFGPDGNKILSGTKYPISLQGYKDATGKSSYTGIPLDSGIGHWEANDANRGGVSYLGLYDELMLGALQNHPQVISKISGGVFERSGLVKKSGSPAYKKAKTRSAATSRERSLSETIHIHDDSFDLIPIVET